MENLYRWVPCVSDGEIFAPKKDVCSDEMVPDKPLRKRFTKSDSICASSESEFLVSKNAMNSARVSLPLFCHT